MKVPTLEDISPHLLSSLEDHELVSLLKHISSGFTSERSRIEEYVNERDQVSAYCSYYLPTNIPKLGFVLDQLPKIVKERMGKLPFIDIGCGPGTYTIGWLSEFKSTPSIHLVDQSSLMLEQAKALIEGLKISPQFATYTPGVPKVEEGVLLFGNSLNEMGASAGMKLVEKHRPEFVILIEPGTKQSFAEVLKMRSGLIALGLNPIYPCSTSTACPLERRDDWCHQVLRMTHDPAIERLSQLASLDRKIMPLIAQVYQRQGVSQVSAHFLRFLVETKFSFMWQVCLHNIEGELEVRSFEIMKRDYPKKFVKRLQQASVGESFKYQVVKELESHSRILLTEFCGEDLSGE